MSTANNTSRLSFSFKYVMETGQTKQMKKSNWFRYDLHDKMTLEHLVFTHLKTKEKLNATIRD